MFNSLSQKHAFAGNMKCPQLTHDTMAETLLQYLSSK